MIRFKVHLFFIFVIFFFTKSIALETDWTNNQEAKVRLISPITSNNSAEKIYIGLEYKLLKDWKTYWKSPGEGGFPQEISWSDSTNIKSLEILWPVPERFEILGMQSIGYSDHVIFPLLLTIEDPLKPIDLVLDITYLTCKEICIPGKAYLNLLIPAGKSFLTEHSYVLEKSISNLPKDNEELGFIENITTQLFSDEKNIQLNFNAEAKNFFKNPQVYLHTQYGLPVIDPIISLSLNLKNLEANFIIDKKLITLDNLNVELIIYDNNQSFIINKLLELKEISIYKKENFSFILIIFIAFLGGLILNAMPCVLPVLSIKLLSILKNVDKSASIRLSFITTAFGIILSFMMLAMSFILLRKLGFSVGWGMQFQQPIFLMIIAIILTLFSLNLYGFYELSIPRFMNTNIISILFKNNFSKDFFNGFFATLMATPCSAPFVGTALTFAFTQSSIMMILIFTSMGFGMASPYLIFSFFPSLFKFFPRPGLWMKYLKYFLGTLLILTLIWIINILMNHFNYYFLLFSIFLFIATVSLIYFLKYKILILLSFVVFFSFSNLPIFKSIDLKNDIDWLDLAEINLNNLINNNEIIFIDITADWCATCQFNKINVLNSKIIQDLFIKNKIVKVRGDWTKPNLIVENFLQKYNRFGIPFNIMYSKKNSSGIIFSEILSEDELIKAIKKLE